MPNLRVSSSSCLSKSGQNWSKKLTFFDAVKNAKTVLCDEVDSTLWLRFLGENDERPLLFGGLWWQPSFDSLSRSTTSSKFWFEVDVNNDGDVDVDVDDEVVVDSDAFPD